MHANFQQILLGLGSGAAYALLAVGLVVIFRGSGVLNFGHGAIASVAAYVFLWSATDVGLNKWVAAAVGILVAALVGALFQFLVMRRLTRAPSLAKVVATLGLLIALQASIPLLFGDRTRPTVPLFPVKVINLPFGDPALIVPLDRLIVVMTAIVLTLAIWLAYRYTRFGIATRAVSENERAVSSLGYSPNTVALVNWAIGAALAGVAGVLMASAVNLAPDTLTLLLMSGIAAALVGGFRSFGITAAAAFALGVVQTLVVRYSPQLTESTSIVGWANLVPFVAIAIFMTFRGVPIPARGTLSELRLPAAPKVKHPLIAASVIAVVGVVLFLVVDERWADALTMTMIGGIACLSLVVLVGFLGQVSAVQMAVAGLGAFWASKAATAWDLPFPLPVLVGGLLAVPFGLLAALPALRVRGISLAVLTISAAFAMDAVFFTDVRLNLGATYPRAEIFGVNLSGIQEPNRFGVFALVVALLCGLGVIWVRQSSLGLRFLALRANERGASSLGMSLVKIKFYGFAIAAFLAGVAGAMYGYRAETLSYSTFGAYSSLLVVAFAYLGGIGSVVGAFVAGTLLPSALFTQLFHVEGSAARVLEVIGGVGVMITCVIHPDGMALLPRDIREHFGGRRRKKASVQAADAVPASREPVPAIHDPATAASAEGVR